MEKDRKFLFKEMKKKKSFLCVGIDPDLDKIPAIFKNDKKPLVSFSRSIVENTINQAIAYKLNIAFFEALGPEGWEQLEEIAAFIPKECLFIADAKRADIGNTSAMYAKYFFERLGADAITLHPYMGIDSLEPFMQYEEKWNIILGLTSNPGSEDIEMLQTSNGRYVYEEVLLKFGNAINADHAMFVVGATHPQKIQSIRNILPDHFLLVPGIGAQGGDLESTIQFGKNKFGGILINVGRSIIYPKQIENSIEKNIQRETQYYQQIMENYF